MRGFFSGLISGAVVVAAGAAVLSLVLPPPPRPDVASQAPAAAPATGPATEDQGTGIGVAPVGADADLVEAAPVAPGADGADPDDLAALDRSDTEPADKPQVGDATAGLQGPARPGAAPQLAADSDRPVAPQPPAGAPVAPGEEAGMPVITDPAQPSLPALPEAGSGFGATPPEADPAPEVATRSDPQVTAAEGGEAVRDPEPDAAPQAATEQAPELAPEPVTDPAPELAPEPASEPAREQMAEPAPQTAPEPAEQMADPAPGAPRMAALPQADGEPAAPQRPSVGTPVVPLTDRDDAAPQAPAEVAVDTVRPLDRFAAPFTDPGDRPLMSILLIDDAGSIGAEALRDFPYPLSFAIDPAAPDAAEKMAGHRAAGFEVVLLADLPGAATAQDAEVALAVWRQAVPEAVAIMEGTGTGIQGNRALSDQVTAIAGSAGLGLITQSNGLNTVQKLAARAGVPSAVIFRDFDGAGQTPTVMRRFLDQAAFRAGQEGAVIMLGRVRPDTISALLLWGLQDRASRVALAPVSAVLTRKPQPQ